MEGARRGAHQGTQLPGGGGFGCGGGDIGATLGAAGGKCHRRGYFAENGRLRPELAEKNGLANLEFRIGDIEEPPIEDNSLDLAVLSQALHHAARPQRAIDAAFRILKPGGRLIVLDLLLHTFEEARELYADRWLGFSECELATMLERAGFTHIETVVADRETSAPGFQTLLVIGVRPA